MKKKVNYHYYVEGENEKYFLEVLKQDLKCIVSGKIDKFNVNQSLFTIARIRPLKEGTIVVLIYDTDVDSTEFLRKNISFLKKQSAIKEVWCIPQIKNLEDEIVYASQIKKVAELTNSKSESDFKRDMIRCTNLGERLKKCGFDVTKIWSRMPNNEFKEFGNNGEKIKL